MGNGIGKIGICFAGGGGGLPRRHDIAVVLTDPLDEGLGHSFCYIRPDPCKVLTHPAEDETTTFRSISGAAVSANVSTPLSTALIDHLCTYAALDRAAAFESSTSFASIPLQPVPRNSIAGSGPLQRCSIGGGPPSSGRYSVGAQQCSGPIERGFLSGPIERSFLSDPFHFSGPVEKERVIDQQLQRSFSHGFKPKSKKASLIKFLRKAISSVRSKPTAPAPTKDLVMDMVLKSNGNFNECVGGAVPVSVNNVTTHLRLSNSTSNDYDGDESLGSQNLQWAQGKAGEDRVHIVVSEQHEWVFVGIYDGFNGPDAPDFLLSNLYASVHKELKGLLWNDKFESTSTAASDSNSDAPSVSASSSPPPPPAASEEFYQSLVENSIELNLNAKRKQSGKSRNRGSARFKRWEESQRKWKGEWDRERLELDRRLREEHLNRTGSAAVNHSDVLKALSQALRKTEDAYLEVADKMVVENPELALMGSCVLVMLMKGEDVYLMNVGDSRAVLGRRTEPNLWLGKAHRDQLERITEETQNDLDGDYQLEGLRSLSALQLTLDHSTYVDEEVDRILNQHPDDASAIINDRVKGSLKVTRAFGAGFLKQPKWNDALLEMFRINYVGTSPYITCLPTLHHHRLSPKDRFLILSSDGLYQYFTNAEVVAEVELFITSFPEGDPAQHLIEEVLFRAAKKAGMDFHELLDIPQGDRRRYHDDVSVIIISLEGRIWRSSV